MMKITVLKLLLADQQSRKTEISTFDKNCTMMQSRVQQSANVRRCVDEKKNKEN